MIAARAKTKFDGKKVLAAARKASISNLGHAGATIRLVARRSIKRSGKASAPGSAPHTRKGRLRSAIKYAVEATVGRVVIGPDVEVAGTSGMAHEFGGRYRREQYDRRPFMGRALDKIKDRLPAMWAGSVK